MVRESNYYIWLRDLVGNPQTHQLLIKQLDKIPFEYVFALDKNRYEGGLNLRAVYSEEMSVDEDDVRTGPCTVLEMLIGLADHMTDQLTCDIPTWFWQLITNLKLDKFDDYNYDARGVEFIIMSWLHRNYTRDGAGSLFPLKDYPGDCRNMDIWSQMNAWIRENYPTDDSWIN